MQKQYKHITICGSKNMKLETIKAIAELAEIAIETYKKKCGRCGTGLYEGYCSNPDCSSILYD